jgi:hypothetical protein
MKGGRYAFGPMVVFIDGETEEVVGYHVRN